VATPKTGMPRGRPRSDFLRDPERFACAIGRAFMSLGASENDAFKRVAALVHGKEVSSHEVAPRRKRGRGFVPGGTSVKYEFDAVRGGSAASIVGKASTLRMKATDTQLDPNAAVLLLLWAFHIANFLAAGGLANLEVGTLFIIELTEQVNNGTLTEAQLLTALNSPMPDFSPND
jgi:hypothetical protein